MAAKQGSTKKSSAQPRTARAKASEGSARAAATSSSAVSYALAAARTTLGEGDPDAVVEEAGGLVTFACRGVAYATLRLQGADIVVTFLRPRDLSGLEPKLPHYRPAKEPGWLEWRRPASRDPRPGLEAGFGQMIGRALYEILQGRHVG